MDIVTQKIVNNIMEKLFILDFLSLFLSLPRAHFINKFKYNSF